MIDQATIDKIKDLAEIEDVVRSYGISLKPKGASLWANCPFPNHEEKTPSFCVTPSRGMCKCFGCGKGGDSINFVREMESVGYLDAIRILAKKYNIELHEHTLTEEEKKQQDRRESLFALNEFADQWFQDQMWKTPTGQDIAWRYFSNRGIREDVARDFHLGYCPDTHSTFYRAAKQAGYSDELLDALGLCKKGEKGYWDFFRGRVMFPIHNAAGRIIAFGGRILEKSDDKAKYFNSKESNEFYVKSRELYGLFQARKTIRTKDHCYLCEGYMDVIAMHQNGLEDAIASCGTSLTEEQAKRISRDTHNITILYDGDKAGIKAAIRAIDLLLPNDMKINVLVLPDDDDPDSFARKHTSEEYIEYIENNQTNWIDYLLQYKYADSLNDINKRTEVIREFVNRLALIPDEIYKNLCLKTISEKLDFDPNLLNQQTIQTGYQQQQRNNYIQQQRNNYQQNNYQQPQNNQPATAPTLDQYAKDVLQFLLRYGDHTLYSDTPDAIKVSNFIIDSLNQDNITFDDQYLNQIFFDYQQLHNTPDFNVENEFLNHPDPTIRGIAIELLFDRYPVSKIFEIEDTTLPLTTGKNAIQEEAVITKRMPSDADNLDELVPKVVYEYKYRILDNEIQQIKQQIKEANDQQNYELVLQLFKDIEPKQQVYLSIAEYLKKVIL